MIRKQIAAAAALAAAIAGTGLMPVAALADADSTTVSGTTEEPQVVYAGDTHMADLYCAAEKKPHRQTVIDEQDGSVYWCADTMDNYWWQAKTGIKKIEQKLHKGSVLVFMLGMNDLEDGNTGAAARYVRLLNSHMDAWEKEGVTVYYVAVTTAPGETTGRVTAKAVETWNATMKKGLDKRIGYIDLEKGMTLAGNKMSRTRLSKADASKLYQRLSELVTSDYSDVYDYKYYRSHNPDLAKAYGDDETAYFRHFITHGMAEGRKASADFDPKAYKARYSDLAKAYGSDMTAYYLHYIRSGYGEGRDGHTTVPAVWHGIDFSAVYDYEYYRANNPDLAKKYGDDETAYFKHFVTYGIKERRRGSSAFDVNYYIAEKPVLKKAYGTKYLNDYLDYIRNGEKESLKGSESGPLVIIHSLVGGSGQHLYVARNTTEYRKLTRNGWTDEGIAWYAPETSDTPVVRFKKDGQPDRYTIKKAEADALTKDGWTNAGIAFYAADAESGVPVYSVSQDAKYLYTADAVLCAESLDKGYKGGGIAWYEAVNESADAETGGEQ